MAAEKGLHRQEKRVKNAETIRLVNLIVECMGQANLVKSNFCRLMITYDIGYCGC